MRTTTIIIDDELYQAAALAVADPGTDRIELIREAMRTFVRVRSGARLAALAGAAPDMPDVPRRGHGRVRETPPSE